MSRATTSGRTQRTPKAAPTDDEGDEREDMADVGQRVRSSRSLRRAASATPCHSGESTANGCSPRGSWLIGKKVPENRNSGRMHEAQ